MSEKARTLAVRSWPVGERTCTVTVRGSSAQAPTHVTFDWAPARPKGLTADGWKQYRAGRNAALAEIGIELGVSVVVAEL